MLVEGNPRSSSYNPFQYRGAYGYIYDYDFALYYLKNRFYNPDLARFISPDKVLGKVGGVFSHNLYAYCTGNPVMRVDPDGHAWFDGVTKAVKKAAAAVETFLRKYAAAKAAAPALIEARIRANMELAKAQLPHTQVVYYELEGSASASLTMSLLWYRDQVKQGGPMDYKDLKRWVDAFPELPYPGETKFYSAFGIPVSASDLGNLNYGAVGKAIGFQEGLLLQQAGAAQLQDHKGMGFLKAQWESLLEPYYGDQWDDQEMIKNGFAITIE